MRKSTPPREKEFFIQLRFWFTVFLSIPERTEFRLLVISWPACCLNTATMLESKKPYVLEVACCKFKVYT